MNQNKSPELITKLFNILALIYDTNSESFVSRNFQTYI